MIQAVQNGKRFAFERDILEIFPDIVYSAAVASALKNMPAAVRDFAAATNTTDADMAQVCTAMAHFINITREDRYVGNDMPAAYIKSGLDRAGQAAAVALYANIGMALTTAFFKHAREALPPEAKTPRLDAMSEMLARAAHASAAGTESTRQRLATELTAEYENAKE